MCLYGVNKRICEKKKIYYNENVNKQNSLWGISRNIEITITKNFLKSRRLAHRVSTTHPNSNHCSPLRCLTCPGLSPAGL